MKTRQTGAALMMALVILTIMTLIGLSALQTSSIDMKIVANKKEQVTAFHAAETGLELAFEDEIDLLGAASYSYTVTSGSLGMDGTTVSMTIQQTDASDDPPGSEGLAARQHAERSDYGPSDYGGSAHAIGGTEFVMTATAQRAGSRARAIHRRAFTSGGAR